MRSAAVLAVVGILVGIASFPSAQSLADAAKKEEERRKTVTATSKVYGNKDLKPVPPPAPRQAADTSPDAPAAASPAAEAVVPAAAAGGASTDKSDDEKKTPAGEVKDQVYWHGRMTALREQLDRDRTYIDALQSRINALNTDFVNRDDPAQRGQISVDRQKALAELDRLRRAVEEGTKSIAALEEEARRSGVPPGWLR